VEVAFFVEHIKTTKATGLSLFVNTADASAFLLFNKFDDLVVHITWIIFTGHDVMSSCSFCMSFPTGRMAIEFFVVALRRVALPSFFDIRQRPGCSSTQAPQPIHLFLY
jgi:hypothetical protein